MTANSIPELIALQAKNKPDVLSLVDIKNEFTYKQLWGYVCGIKDLLIEKGVKEGDCVVVKNMQNAYQIAVGAAIQLMRAIFVPLEKVSADERFCDIINKTESKIFIADKPIDFEQYGISGVEYISAKELEGAYCKNPPQFDEVQFPELEAVSTILFTTGTTGDSKGIEITNHNDIALAENVKYGVEMKDGNVELIPMPLNHSFALRRTYANLLNGSTVCFMDGVVFIKRFYGFIEKYSVTAVALAPAALAIVFKLSEDKIGEYADQIDYVQLGSAPLPEDDKQRLRKLLPKSRLYNIYGSTEAGCASALNFNSDKIRPNCIGKPTVNSIFKVIDENGNEIQSSAENTGFLISGGTMSTKAYYKAPEITKKIIKDGFIYSTDIGYIDEEGYIYMLGRQDDVINSGGNKIAPTEVEEVVMRQGDIEECACVPMDDPLLTQVPKLFVVMKQDKPFNEAELYKYLTQTLEGYKVPKVIVEIQAIPRTYNGKIDRKELKKM